MPSSASHRLAEIVAVSTFVEVARRLGCTEGSVRGYVLRSVRPGLTIRNRALEAYGIAIDAWDTAAMPPVAETETPVAPPPPPVDAEEPSARSVLDAELARLDRLEASSRDWSPRDRVGLSTARAGIAARLAKFTGEEATDERRLLDSPAFRLVMRTVAETLAPYPVPAAAVSAALRALDEKRTAP